MTCTICKKYPALVGKCDFITGTDNFKKETLQCHSISKKHIAARDADRSRQGSIVAGQSTIHAAFVQQRTKQTEKDNVDLKCKLNTAYVLAKEEQPFTKFKPLLDLQKKNGLDISSTYANHVMAAELVHTISETFKDEVGCTVKSNSYISIMIDGATDSSVKENEAIICRCLQDGKPFNKFLGLWELEHCDADGVLTAVKKAFSSIDDPEFLQRLVGFCADGASVNLGKDNGVKAKLTRDCPWLVSIWCLPHRLELTVMGMVKNCRDAEQVIDVLHWIYKTYHFSPKSRRELKRLATELGVNVRNPARVKGTRWTPHLQKALHILLHSKSHSEIGQYGVVLQHSKHVASTSNNAEIKGRFQNIAKRLKTFSFLTMAHFLLDFFEIISTLSETLQSNKTIFSTAVSALQNTIARLDNLMMRPLPQGYLYKFLCNVAANPEEFQFQGVALSNVPANIQVEPTEMISSLPNSLKEAIKSTVTHTTKGMKTRMSALLSSDVELSGESKAVASFKIFNHDSWPSDDNHLVDFGEEEIKTLLDWFKEPLERNKCEIGKVLGQWCSLKMLVVREFSDKSYSALWATLLTKEPYKSDYKDLLHLVQILLVLPISSAQCERIFSAQKRIKSDVRSSLATETLEDLIRISADGPPLEDFQPESSAAKWTNSSGRPRKLQYTEWPDVLIPADDDDDD